MQGELVHHGIKGQKWGVIRTPEQLGHVTNTEEKKPGWLDQNVKQGKDKPNISPAEKVAKDAEKVVDASGKIIDTVDKMTDKKSDYSEMSDAELRKRIERLRMERDLDQLTKSERRSGMETTKNILEIVGSSVVIVGGLVGIAAQVKKMLG